MHQPLPAYRQLAVAGILAALSLTARPTVAQDNILIYGNSIINGPTVGFFEDLVAQTGQPTPNVVTWILGNQSTTNYVNQIGLITSSLSAGQTWKAMVVEGATLETTNFMGNPVGFQANMLTLGNALFAHSPNALFIGHETGADHPNSTRYPSWFPNAAAWLAFPQAAYQQAAEAITAANPSSPAAQVAKQGTCYANTIGYGLPFYQSDLHHLSNQGKALVACLYFIEIYGGRIEDIAVDFAVGTPLVNRLLANGIDEAKWNKVVGFADRSQPRGMRPYPGSDSDFQMRIGPSANQLNLRVTKQVAGGDQLAVRMVSPLDAVTSFPAGIYLQQLPTGTPPNVGAFPGLQLDRMLLTTWFGVPDLNGSAVMWTIPFGLSGQTVWLQAASRGPSGSGAYPVAFSDAQRIEIQ
tara:strand:+ start:16339 stop:17568 length:1230 start_codon:yes stop_codon:yes gene_type:complete